jgi:glycosyltransferase involved in cell wall biosynthesis
VGDGDHIPHLLLLRDKLQADFVEFHPPVSITDIPVLASNCHATIQPQLQDCHTDLCFSTKVIESFAMGLPVIASATETLKRYFDDTQIVFFEPGNEEDLASAIERVYFDKDLRKSLVYEGLKLSSSLNWELEKPKFLKIIESMLGRKSAEEGAIVD